MKTINDLDFTKLWHSEYPFVYNKVVEIVEKHNPQKLHLKNALDRVKVHLPALRKIEIQERSSIYSKRLEEVDNHRDNLTHAIYDMVKAWLMADLDETREQAEMVMDVLKKYHVRFLAEEEYLIQTQHTKELFNAIENDNALIDALNEIHLAPLFSELKKVNRKFERIFTQRTYEQAELEKVDCKAIRNAADKEMERLLMLINLYQTEYPKLNYQQLINELNQLLDYHKSIVKKRTIRFIEENRQYFGSDDLISTPMN